MHPKPHDYIKNYSFLSLDEVKIRQKNKINNNNYLILFTNMIMRRTFNDLHTKMQGQMRPTGLCALEGD